MAILLVIAMNPSEASDHSSLADHRVKRARNIREAQTLLEKDDLTWWSRIVTVASANWAG